MYTISQLFIYPVKSLGGIEITGAQLTDRGFQFDRRWMLVDVNNQFLTQREHPEMCLLQTAIQDNELIVYHKNNPADNIQIPLQPLPGVATIKVQVWDDECSAQLVSEAADAWFSAKLSIPCRLVYMPDSEKRKVDPEYASENDITSFSDGYPLLIIGQASMDDLNSRLAEPLSINRFRPNIVFSGGNAFDEDTMEHVRINSINLYGVKLCARCTITTINQATAERAKEPLKALAAYRMKNSKIYFGQNILHKQTGALKVGDAIEIISKKVPFAFIPSAQ
ncbi:MOSC domain-containing protein [Ferruginibacter paludis]|uniref:MOSC domain-containing protein n=1 Tax=Ferruginibacter paludis TaxID=1310417 RepID=UPI0025B3C89C|nr:MOSC N-terminal beta barrel domain-containing protein [Ferruginibacter paludis]MDN3654332.1 MOSC domain-containing protein [Ferruginibacter paludis]